MQAVIVAAGKSSRLYPRTLNFPKSLLPINEKAIIKYSIEKLKRVGVEKIFVVTGYSHSKLKTELKDEVTFINNPFYADCNNMGSLWFAKHYINDSFFYLHADIMYEESILINCLESAKKTDCIMSLAVDFDAKLDEETMNVLINEGNLLVESSKNIEASQAHGEWTGISFINNPDLVFSAIEDYLMDTDKNSYDTAVFSRIAQSNPIVCCKTNSANWLEIDFEEDYQRAIKMFSNREQS
jgi:choline kinase